ncbi:RNA pyrophosphohydrolase [Helicobacter didelphidarum]|uniref:RNA pyrophosphohydrolase n=1 Tax=Helicobacter didelphidarum TaxID=2040648 RepID=A0A3D8INC8_9HELI|nr:RNA pyrophosphohydrolase [Helicobacter didelphidarum]
MSDFHNIVTDKNYHQNELKKLNTCYNYEKFKNFEKQNKSCNDKQKKNYRPNVCAIILSSCYPDNREFFIAERLDLKGVWQFPQGGIEPGESPKEALYRELKEEIGTNHIEIIAEHPEWLSYDFPPNIAKRMYPYDGQIQKYFLVRLKKDSIINIQTKEPEFTRYEFVDYELLLQRITHFKRSIYMCTLNYFRKKGYI